MRLPLSVALYLLCTCCRWRSINCCCCCCCCKWLLQTVNCSYLLCTHAHDLPSMPKRERELSRATPEDLRRMVMARCDLRSHDFEPRYDFEYSESACRRIRRLRGGESYDPPQGWTKLALSVTGQYDDDDDWLDRECGWAVAYHGTRADPDIIKGIVRDGIRIQGGRSTAHTSREIACCGTWVGNSRMDQPFRTQELGHVRDVETL